MASYPEAYKRSPVLKSTLLSYSAVQAINKTKMTGQALGYKAPAACLGFGLILC